MATDRNGRRPARRPEKPQAKEQTVVYTPGKPFRRSRLVLQLLTVLALVAALFLGMSVFFKVDSIQVSGINKHTAEEVAEASGIRIGDNLFFFGRGGAYKRITDKLAYVKKVRFGIELPGTVKILVEEAPVVYAIQDSQSDWWLMDSDGRITEQGDSASVRDLTQIVGVTLRTPQVGQNAVAAETESQEDPEGETPVVSLAADRLKAALEITRQLEANQILGKVTQVDVSDTQQLRFQYGTRFRVELGDAMRLDFKIALVNATIEGLGSQTAGVLDASLKTITEGIQYRPLEE